MSINFRLHATLWESSAKLKTPSPALIRHIKHSFSFEINLIIRYAKGPNCKFQLPITLCHYQLFLTDIGPEVNIQEGFQIRGTCMMVSSCLLPQLIHSVASEISLFTFCLRPAQSAHPSMSNSPNESLIQGKDYKFPKLYPFHIDQWDFWSQGSVASISQASDWHLLPENDCIHPGEICCKHRCVGTWTCLPSSQGWYEVSTSLWNTCLCTDLVKDTITPLDCMTWWNQDLRKGSERKNSTLLEPMLLQGTCLQMKKLLLRSSIL